jgi:hypothetical protein
MDCLQEFGRLRTESTINAADLVSTTCPPYPVMPLLQEIAMSLKIGPAVTATPHRPANDRKATRAFETRLRTFLEQQSEQARQMQEASLQIHCCQLKLARSLFAEEDADQDVLPAMEFPKAEFPAGAGHWRIFDSSPAPGGPLTESGAPPSDRSHSRTDMEHLIDRAAARHGLAPELIRSVIRTESAFDPRAMSPAGARGLMQLMPATAAELGVTDPFDPEQNIMAGTRYLRQLLDRYNGDLDHALAAYNWGMGNVDRHGLARLPEETRNYLLRIKQA